MMIEEAAGVAEPPVQVSFVPTIDDLVHATQETMRGGRRRRRWKEIALPVALAALLAVQVAQRGASVLLPLGVPLLLLFAVLVGAPLLVRWSVVRQRRQNPHFDGPVAYTFTAEGVHVQTPLGASHMPWTSFVRARETPEQILLFFGSKSAYFMPRRALREEDERRLRALLAARLGPLAELTNESTGR